MQNNRGFTLIEIMVIIIIVGIVGSVALYSFGDFGASRKVTITAEHFSSYIKLVQQKAILEGSTLGLNIDKESYETLSLQKGQWIALSKSYFKKQYFPKNIQANLTFPSTNRKNHPDIIIYPTGNMSVFSLDFGTAVKPSLITLNGKVNGDIQIRAAYEKKTP